MISFTVIAALIKSNTVTYYKWRDIFSQGYPAVKSHTALIVFLLCF